MGENFDDVTRCHTFGLISPAQYHAIEALVSGSSVTAAARAAGVARETVSRWMHHDPAFIAELENTRSEIAAQTRLALEALGMRAIATLREAIENRFMLPTRLRAACAVLKAPRIPGLVKSGRLLSTLSVERVAQTFLSVGVDRNVGMVQIRVAIPWCC